jgi:ATP-dependent DNA helicase DinG
MSKSDTYQHVFFQDRIVFLDIETTGLNPETDRIIEIGAIAVENDIVTDRFSTLINPGKPLPLVIQRLCGLTDGDLREAPSLPDITDALQRFLADSPVVAHYSDFEASFFKSHGLPKPVYWLDSLVPATLLRPDLTEHNLERLICETGLREWEIHRGLQDAEDTFQVLLSFCRSNALPADFWSLMQRLLQPPHNGWSFLFDRLESFSRRSPARPAEKVLSAQQAKKEIASVSPSEPDALHSIFCLDGVLAGMEGMRYRPGQYTMAREVACTLEAECIQVIEAGTGSGKSLAYLVPAALHALRNGYPVAVSTETRNLQHQLANHELPRVDKLLGNTLRWVVLKGRENYICHYRVAERIRNIDLSDSPDDRFLLAALQAALLHPDATGDMDHFSYRVCNRAEQGSVITASIRNTGKHCGSHCRYESQCPYNRTLRQAASAHILIVNHALSLRWPEHYPDVSRFIFDEAHNLEDTATSVFGETVTFFTLAALNSTLLHSRNGWFPRMRRSTAAMECLQANAVTGTFDNAAVLAGTYGSLLQRTLEIIESRIAAERHWKTGDASHPDAVFAYSFAIDELDISKRLRNGVLTVLQNLTVFFTDILDLLSRVAACSGEFPVELKHDTYSLIDSLVDIRDFLVRFTATEKLGYVYSVHYEHKDTLSTFELREEPINVARIMNRYIWSRLNAAVLTSATLTTATWTNEPSTHFFKYRLGYFFIDPVKQKRDCIISSPFNYRRQMVAVQPAGLPEMDICDPGPILQKHREIIREVSRHFGGRTLVLMVSSSRQAILGNWLETDLEPDRILVLKQGSRSRDALVRSMRQNEQSVLIGVKSFWEGVDIPGDSLQVVTIEKIPFAPPNDPLIKARLKTYGDNFWKGFLNYMLPLALIRLRQGIGRLIRSETDSGVVLFLSHRAKPSYRRQVEAVFPSPLIAEHVWPVIFAQIQERFPCKGDS